MGTGSGTAAGTTGTTGAGDANGTLGAGTDSGDAGDGNATQDPNHPTSGPTVRTIGRFAAADANGASAFSWPASTMLTRILGDDVSIALSSEGNETYQDHSVSSWFDVFIDGNKTSTFSLVPGVDSYALADGLTYGEHTVAVVKRTEPQMGAARFSGFVPGANTTLLPAPLARARQIEFIGDSITAGYGADGNVATYAGCPNFTIETENAGSTFASMTASAVGAEMMAIAFSGKGIAQNDDCFGDPNLTMPVLYPTVLPGKGQSVWDYSAWSPQAVVINLGTNDYNMNNGCAIPTDDAFTQAWVGLLGTVRSRYPDAFILCTVGPEVPSTNLARAQANIQAAVQNVQDAGDDKVSYVALAADTGANGYGCAGHPNKATHAIMAGVVRQALADALGW